jgi:hypothetical protein
MTGFMDTCDYCNESVRSVYSFQFEGKWYNCHKHCCNLKIRELEMERARDSLFEDSRSVLGQTVDNMSKALNTPGEMKSYIEEFYKINGIEKGSKLSPDIKSQLAKFMADKIMNRHKER